MPLMESHKPYHQLAPKDIGLQGPMPIQISRTTSQTGEQFTFEVPVYPDDTREVLRKRVNFALSIIQDRMEDENAAILERAKKAALRKAEKTNEMKVKAIERQLKRKKITQEEADLQLAEAKEDYAGALEQIHIEYASEAPAEETEEKDQAVAQEA